MERDELLLLLQDQVPYVNWEYLFMADSLATETLVDVTLNLIGRIKVLETELSQLKGKS